MEDEAALYEVQSTSSSTKRKGQRSNAHEVSLSRKIMFL